MSWRSQNDFVAPRCAAPVSTAMPPSLPYRNRISLLRSTAAYPDLRAQVFSFAGSNPSQGYGSVL